MFYIFPMTNDLSPVPSGQVRQEMATRVRNEATNLAHERVDSSIDQKNNGEAKKALCESDNDLVFAPGTFSKGLRHDDYGRVKIADLREFVSQINQDMAGSDLGETPFPGTYKGPKAGCPAPFEAPKYEHETGEQWNWPLKMKPHARNWESPLAGHALEIDGPDADDVSIPPAPSLGSSELIAEIAEVYAMALIRDIPFSKWKDDSKVQAMVESLNKLEFFKSDANLGQRAKKRRKARFLDGGKLTVENVFRGSTPGAQSGPYISQFLLAGNKETLSAPDHSKEGQQLWDAVQSVDDALTRTKYFIPTELRAGSGRGRSEEETQSDRALGFIKYGPQAISQKIIPHRPWRDHMTDWGSWHDVQNGANRKGLDYYLEKDDEPLSRFILTPRDIASYVHVDQLYQAYLNACLILLSEEKTVVDVGLPEGPFIEPEQGHDTRDGFALFGGPHILTLVCECATRALKAVRRQKYNVHLRARPEFLAAAITAQWNGAEADGQSVLGDSLGDLKRMVDALTECGLLELISSHNQKQNEKWSSFDWPVNLQWINPEKNGLLPMAFPEGSPMHPSYGAGHATVAGACVTVLKAFFEMYTVSDGGGFKNNRVKRGELDLLKIKKDPTEFPNELFRAERELSDIGFSEAYEADAATDGIRLKKVSITNLTIQGELDKLAANIAIGRDFAGVHFYTDYYESLRMGERIAIGMLQEQMLTYREPLSMRLRSFDGDHLMLASTGGSRGLNDALVYVWDRDEQPVEYSDWWRR